MNRDAMKNDRIGRNRKELEAILATLDDIRHIAQQQFGYQELHAAQENAILSVLAGHDTLSVLPTGFGKSAIYQIAGAVLGGTTLVISPLIALQLDQMQAMQAQDRGVVAQLNSTQSATERSETLERLAAGALDFLLLAPEQFGNDAVLAAAQSAHIPLFVVDEAHCISEWGHDFRPDYLRLGAIAEALGRPTLLALTATAAPPVREEIIERLGMRNAKTLVHGFDRPNIWLGVETFHNEASKTQALLNRVLEAEKPGIVYVATRHAAATLAQTLTERGIRAVAYHAGMRDEDRERAQSEFMGDQAQVIVATSAFGMGVDKPNVRFVFHNSVSDSVDAYYQEIGRAGRDGAPARAILFYRSEDLNLRRFFAGTGKVDEEEISRVALALETQTGDGNEPVDPTDLREAAHLSATKLHTALTRLADVGLVDTLPTGEVVADGELAEPDAHRKGDLREVAAEAAEAQQRRQQFERSRIEMLRGYAEVYDCRRRYLLNYFGEAYEHACGYCDNCQVGHGVATDLGMRPFPLNSRVRHRAWGEGLVMRYDGDKIVALFDEVGYKTLALDLVLENDLLTPAE